MPTYSYACEVCDNKFDKILPLKDYKEEQHCPYCGGNAKKQMALGGVRTDHPVWLNQSVRNQLQDTDSPHIPIETRTQHDNFLRDTGITAL